jgi:anti-sigma factor RsiW
MSNPHIRQEQISAYLDRQLGVEESLALETHLAECESCRIVCGEMREVTSLFREAESLEPSPFLWNRIASELDKEKPSADGKIAAMIAGLRNFGWGFRAAAATLVVFLVLGIAILRIDRSQVADRAALTEIDRVCESLASQDPDVYNPFSSGSPRDSDTNPFRSLRLSGKTESVPGSADRH